MPISASSSPAPSQSPKQWRGLLYDLALAAFVTGVYCTSAKISLNFVVQPDNIAIIWLPAAILPAALLLTRRRVWLFAVPMIFVSDALLNWLYGNSIPMSLGYALANCVEGLIVAVLLRRWGVTATNISTVRSILIVGLVGVPVIALTDVIGTVIPALLAGAPFWPAWLIWFVADGLSILLGVPLILAWAGLIQSHPGWPSPGKWIEGALSVAVICSISWIVFSPRSPFLGRLVLFPYVLFPLLIWSALRFPTPIGAIFNVLITAFALWGTANGGGAFYTGLQMIKPSLITAQFFASVVTYTMLILRGVIDDRQRAQESLRQSELRYRDLAESIADMFFAMDVDARNIYWNKAAEKLTGISAEDAIGKSPFELFPEMKGTQTEAACREVLKTQQAQTIVQTYGVGDEKRTHEINVYPSGLGLVVLARDITERRQVEEALREGEERYRELFHSVPAGLYRTAADGRFLQVNSMFANIMGYPNLDAVMQKNAADIYLSLEDRQTWMNKVERADILTGYEVQVRRHDGTPIWISDTARKVVDDAGKFLYFEGAIVDITERKRAEEALHESEERYRAIAESAHDAIVTADFNDVIVAWNHGAQQMFGYDRSEIVGQPIDRLMPERFRESHRSAMLRIGVGHPRQAAGRTIELHGLRKDGSEFPLELSLADWETAQGTFYTGIMRDITERKQAEKSLRESALQYHTMVRTSLDGFYVIDTGGHILEVNDAYCNLVGYSRAELLSMRVQDVEARETAAQTEEHIKRIVKTGSDRFETSHCHKDGRVIDIEASVTYLPLEGGRFYVFMHDITKRRQADETLRRSELRFRTVFDQSPLGMTMADAESGCYLEINPKFCDIVGRSRDELLRADFRSITHPDDLQLDLDFAGRLKASEISHFTIEKRYLRPDNSVVWVNMSVVPLWMGEGTQLCHVALIEDITERKLAEDLMRSRVHLSEYAPKHSLDDLLRETLDEAERLTDSQIGFFHFVDDDQKNLTLQMWSTNTLENMCHAETMGVRYPVDEAGVWADCVREGRSVIHNDYANLPHRKGTPEGHVPVIRELVVPVIRDDRMVAIVGVGNKPGNYGEIENKTLSELANMAWDIVVRKQTEATLARHIDQLTLLSQVSRQIAGPLDINSVLEQTARLIHELFHYDHVRLFIFDVKSNRLEMRAMAGSDIDRFPHRHSHKVGEGLVGVAARDKQTVLSNDVNQAPQFHNLFKDLSISSEISVPIKLANSLIGVLDVQSHSLNAFGDVDVLVLEALADQLAVALQNARLFEAERQERTLAQTYQHAIEAMIEFDTIEHALDQVAGLLGDLVAFDRLIILLVEDDELRVVAYRDIHHNEESALRPYCYPEIPLLYKSMSDVETVVLSNGGLNPDYLDLPGYTTATTSWVGIPLPTSSVVIGYLCVATDHPNGYSRSDVQALNAFARQVVLALGHSRLLAQVEQSHARLTRLARLSAAGEIATGVAHQINNPLTAVVTQAHLLMRSFPHDSEAYQRGSKIEHAALRAANVVQRMLDLARAHPQSMATLDLKKSVADAISLVRPQIEPHIAHIDMDLCLQELPIEGSEDHLLDVWLNLLLNARDALEGVANARITVSVFLADDANEARVRFADNGPGVLPDQQARIFDPFVTTKPHGTGLGLSICHEIISQHSGTIILETPTMGGASFLICLPIAHPTTDNKDA